MFVHIFKTAGTSIRDQFLDDARLRDRFVYKYRWSMRFFYALSRILNTVEGVTIFVAGCKKHASAREIKRYLGRKYDPLFSFAFVRNPWDLCVSLYFYLQTDKHHFYHDRACELEFEPFLEFYLNEKPPRQVDFVTDESGNVIVDYIGKFETLEDDLEAITARLKISRKETGQKNRSANRQKKDYRSYYSERGKGLVADYFRADIEQFGYQF